MQIFRKLILLRSFFLFIELLCMQITRYAGHHFLRAAPLPYFFLNNISSTIRIKKVENKKPFKKITPFLFVPVHYFSLTFRPSLYSNDFNFFLDSLTFSGFLLHAYRVKEVILKRQMLEKCLLYREIFSSYCSLLPFHFKALLFDSPVYRVGI